MLFINILLNILTLIVSTWIYIIIGCMALVFARFCLKGFEIKYERVKPLFLFNYFVPLLYTLGMLSANVITRGQILLRITILSILAWGATIVVAHYKSLS